MHATNMIGELIELTGTQWEYYWVAIFIMPLFFFIFWLRTLNVLGPFVIVSNILTFASIMVIFGFIFDKIDFTQYTPYKSKDFYQVHAFYGIYIFSIETSGVVST